MSMGGGGSRDMQVGSTGGSKLPVGVNVSISAFACMCVCYVIDRQHVNVLHPVHAGMDSNPSEAHNRINSSEIGWRAGHHMCQFQCICVVDYVLMPLNSHHFSASLMIFEQGQPPDTHTSMS